MVLWIVLLISIKIQNALDSYVSEKKSNKLCSMELKFTPKYAVQIKCKEYRIQFNQSKQTNNNLSEVNEKDIKKTWKTLFSLTGI